jgi:hypothetical protein
MLERPETDSGGVLNPDSAVPNRMTAIGACFGPA